MEDLAILPMMGKLKLENIPLTWGIPCQSCKDGYGCAKDYKIFCQTSILSTYIEETRAIDMKNSFILEMGTMTFVQC